MQRRALFAVFLLTAAAGLSAAHAEPASAYRIGIILPLTGKAASIGLPLRQGAELAAGGQAHPVEVLYEDDEGAPQKAVSAYQKLRATGGLGAAIVFGSGIGNALAPLAERDKIVLFALIASDEKVWRGRRFVFSHWMPIEREGEAMVGEIRRREYKRVGRVSHEQEGINALDSVFDRAMEEAGIAERVVFREKCLMDTVDYRPIIARARASQIDALQVTMIPGPAVFAKQARELGFKGDLFGFHTFENESERAAGGEALAGSWYVSQDEPTAEFRRAFETRFQEPPSIGSANAYDAVLLLRESVRLFGRDNEKIAAHIRTVKDFSGASGTYSATGDSRFTIRAAVKTITPQGFARAGNEGDPER